jgi:hypothetical protein
MRAILAEERTRHEAGLQRYLDLEPQLAESEPFPLATLRFGIRYERATLEWLDELEQVLDQESPGGI